MSFAATTLFVASQRMSVVVYFVIDSVRKLLDTPLYFLFSLSKCFLKGPFPEVKGTTKHACNKKSTNRKANATFRNIG